MNKKVAESLEDIFSLSSPETLKKSLNEVFYSYLMNTEILPSNFKEIATDIYFLNDFLEKANLHYKSPQKK